MNISYIQVPDDIFSEPRRLCLHCSGCLTFELYFCLQKKRFLFRLTQQKRSSGQWMIGGGEGRFRRSGISWQGQVNLPQSRACPVFGLESQL